MWKLKRNYSTFSSFYSAKIQNPSTSVYQMSNTMKLEQPPLFEITHAFEIIKHTWSELEQGYLMAGIQTETHIVPVILFRDFERKIFRAYKIKKSNLIGCE